MPHAHPLLPPSLDKVYDILEEVKIVELLIM